jgi:hypothetical protein
MPQGETVCLPPPHRLLYPIRHGMTYKGEALGSAGASVGNPAI